MEIVKLIGADILPDDQKLVIESARVGTPWIPTAKRYLRHGYLRPIEKQFKMMEILLYFYERGKE
jgi:V/A-type H+-transporting ATPase subunit A